MILRDYQHQASDRIIDEFSEVNSTLLVLATGLGKTIVFADVIRRMFPQRSMVLAHRRELIYQARDKIQAATGLECGIEMGGLSLTNGLLEKTPVVISTIQTQISGGENGRRMGRFDPLEYGLVVVDEAHRGVSSSYSDALGYYQKNQDLRLLGVTATPDRLDEVALGKVFKTVAMVYEIQDGIGNGWLVPIQQLCCQISGLDYSNIRTTAGDLNGADLAAVMEAESNSHRIVQASLESMFGVTPNSLSTIEVDGWKEHLYSNGKLKRTLVFCASVKQAETMSGIFNRVSPGMSSWVCAKTPDDERDQLVRDFADGRVGVVCNVDVLSEGYDNPYVECVIQARATKSRSRYSQQIGRGTRALPGIVDGLDTSVQRKEAIAASAKQSLTVVDMVGNSGRHKLMTTADILGGDHDDEVIARVIRYVSKAGRPVDITEAMREEEKKMRQEAEERRLANEARKARLVVKSRYTARYVDPFDALDITPGRTRGWDEGKVLSEKQRQLLLKQGVDPDQVGYTAGRTIIMELFRRWRGGLCSMKQAAVLKRYGYEPKEWTREQASGVLDALAKNKWKPLAALPVFQQKGTT